MNGKSPASSPMLDQYRKIKKEHQGEVLFFRLGDFYEMFADDALEVSSLLNLTLTSRNGQPMCGIPYHAARSYIARLLRLGKKIAICEQITEPGKGLIERKVVEVVTPGTTVDEDYLEKGSPNYLCCFAALGPAYSFAYIDLSAGDFFATSFREGAAEKLRQELERLDAREMIVQESLLEEHPFFAAAVHDRPNLVLNRWADWLFDMERGKERLARQFGTANLKGFGLKDNAPEIIAAGALLDYLDETSRSLTPHIRSISVYEDTQFVGIDESTQRNLELIRNLQNNDSAFTLFEVMDQTRTAMGRRLLKTRLLHPLRDQAKIQARQDAVEVFYRKQEILSRVRELLAKTPDLERLLSRIAMDKAHGKDMAGVKNALEYFFKIETECAELSLAFETPEAALLDNRTHNANTAREQIADLLGLLAKALTEDPSILLTEGNLIRDGYNPELDKLRNLRDNGRKLLENYLEDERQNTGIPSLKIRYNRMIGYFFEVRSNHLSKVPNYFIRRQGMATGERFTTNKLAELESAINGASGTIVELERKLFLEIRETAKTILPELYAAARRIAETDTAQSLARAATIHGWIRPIVDNENRLRIIEGRHPVVEAHLNHGEFIPNDVQLDTHTVSFALITGPNMAGKSTYLRQTALTVIMAQTGSFVPAREANIGMCDRIYCRVGASDNLARGESTFLVEMNETAYILRSATGNSLVIMDEVGRGTGTSDGLSIAWAVCEDILNRIKCRTLFATHYHELSTITHPAMANRSMEAEETNGRIVFVRKLKEGPATESYGLHVARLAGLPEPVLERAEEILDEIRRTNNSANTTAPATTKTDTPEPKKAPPDSAFYRKLSRLDVNAMSPLEALNLLAHWKQEALSNTNAPAPRQPKPQPRAEKQENSPSLFD